ncbi:MAG: hypothetical protein ACK5LY_00690 [Lachnospirales bacterium]
MLQQIGERVQALKLLEKPFCGYGKKVIILFDRGYPSQEFISQLYKKDYFFVMRNSTSFLKICVNCDIGDHIVSYEFKGELFKLRVVKFELNTGEIESLVPNIFDENFTISDFKELYFLR